MSTTEKFPRPDPRIHRDVPSILGPRGFDPAAIEALIDFDVAAFLHRRMQEKGDFKGKAMAAMEVRLEPAMLQGLVAVLRVSEGIGSGEPRPATIGLVAAEMEIDPSRASRIVTELVNRGMITRAPVQDDGRKTMLVMSDAGWDFLRKFGRSKWELLADVFDGWSTEDITRFSQLFERYVHALTARIAEMD